MKRLFVALRIEAPWPEELPRGRVIAAEVRHLTLSFLGQQDEGKVLSLMPAMPPYPLALGTAGYFDKCLFLPHGHPRVVSWHLALGEQEKPLSDFAHSVQEYFHAQGIEVEQKNTWLPHATIAREPFFSEDWEKSFTPLPFAITGCALFESQGNLHYESLWQIPFVPPFEKLSHTADIGFLVRGQTYEQLYHNARIALAFEYPPFLAYESNGAAPQSFEDVVRTLNQLVTAMDVATGSPFKAVSYHGQAKPLGNYMEWEMIVDV